MAGVQAEVDVARGRSTRRTARSPAGSRRGESACEWNCTRRPYSSSTRRPSSSIPVVRRSHCRRSSVGDSIGAPVLWSRHGSGMTTRCSPPTARVSAATSVTCFQTWSQAAGPVQVLEHGAGQHGQAVGAQGVGELGRVGRQVAVRAELDDVVAGGGDLGEEAVGRGLLGVAGEPDAPRVGGGTDGDLGCCAHGDTSSLGWRKTLLGGLGVVVGLAGTLGGLEGRDLGDRDVPPGAGVGGGDQRVGLDVDDDAGRGGLAPHAGRRRTRRRSGRAGHGRRATPRSRRGRRAAGRRRDARSPTGSGSGCRSAASRAPRTARRSRRSRGSARGR